MPVQIKRLSIRRMRESGGKRILQQTRSQLILDIIAWRRSANSPFSNPFMLERSSSTLVWQVSPSSSTPFS